MVHRLARKEGLVGKREGPLVDKRLQWLYVPPIDVEELVRLLPRGQEIFDALVSGCWAAKEPEQGHVAGV